MPWTSMFFHWKLWKFILLSYQCLCVSLEVQFIANFFLNATPLHVLMSQPYSSYDVRSRLELENTHLTNLRRLGQRIPAFHHHRQSPEGSDRRKYCRTAVLNFIYVSYMYVRMARPLCIQPDGVFFLEINVYCLFWRTPVKHHNCI